MARKKAIPPVISPPLVEVAKASALKVAAAKVSSSSWTRVGALIGAMAGGFFTNHSLQSAHIDAVAQVQTVHSDSTSRTLYRKLRTKDSIDAVHRDSVINYKLDSLLAR